MFKIYVGNLDLRVTAEMLKPYFEPFGDLDEIVIATDAKTGKSRGFAIVLFKDPMKGQLAIETLTGKKIAGRNIVINEAIKKGKRSRMEPAGKPVRQGPFGPRYQAGRGGSGPPGAPQRRSSSRNPRRGFLGNRPSPGPGGPGAPPRPPGSPGQAPPGGPTSPPRPPSPPRGPDAGHGGDQPGG